MSALHTSAPHSARSSPASTPLNMSRHTSASPAPSSASASQHGQETQESDNDSQGVQMILRIKRKRNQDPVEALIINQNERRSKRRSMVFPDTTNEAPTSSRHGSAEPSEASQSKQRGVFRLAETVSLQSFSDPIAARKLHQRISALSRGSPAGPSTKPLHPSKLSQSVSSPSLTQTMQHSLRQASATSTAVASDNIAGASRTQRSLANSVPSLLKSADASTSATPAERVKALASEQIDRDKERRSRSSTPVGMRFRVVMKDSAGKGLRRSGSSASLRKMRSGALQSSPWHTSARPPEIRSRKEKEAEAIFGRILDAETESSGPAASSSAPKAPRGKQSKAAQPDAEMEGLDAKFAEMLGDYLRSNNMEPAQDLDQMVQGTSQADAAVPGSIVPSPGLDDEDGDEEDYVYDVYYRDMLPTKAGPQGSAETGLQPAQVAGREKGASAAYGAVPDSMALPRVLGGEVVPPESAAPAVAFPGLDFAGPNAVIAHLEGFVDSDDELEQADEEGFESFDEGEDEDSNDEGFYRNDYPEQELPDADEVDFDYDDDDSDLDEHDQYSLSDGSF
ncbi:hypothetical protein PaG_02619 [Moesziomyces aphidis]|uniref:Transcription factor Iwr1 domain-containing protein n=1 Tax=Moesziomyces aphidis TaxID=84754 RepID=W3VPZ9_MOEAP|nr:hypothetical protein PaG_02619 [Moesziomyces aphidis]